MRPAHAGFAQSALSSKRFLGLELSGAQNAKTVFAALELFPKERKIFLLDVHERIQAADGEDADQALIRELLRQAPRGATLAVNVPLTLPPCIRCERRHCPLPKHCSVREVRWMRAHSPPARERCLTPYTQRAAELWVRSRVLPALGDEFGVEVDETLGGSRAPLTARMQLLQRHLAPLRLLEVWPKLSVAILLRNLQKKRPGGDTAFRRLYRRYRQVEDGAPARLEILEAFMESFGVFIYERDAQKLAQSLGAFDAFVCAYTALLAEIGHSALPPKGFPAGTGWIQYPKLIEGSRA